MELSIMETTSLILNTKTGVEASSCTCKLSSCPPAGSFRGMCSSRSYLQGLALLEDPQGEFGQDPPGDPLPLRGFVNHLSLRAAWPEKHGKNTS